MAKRTIGEQRRGGALNDGSGNADTTSPLWSFTATTDPDMVGSIAPQAFSLQASAASSCPSRLYTGVRGTTESAGSGKSRWGHGWTKGGYGETKQLGQRLRNHVGGITDESLNYPASWAGVFGSAYWNSRSAGQKNLIAEMNSVAKKCPSTKTWLSGHSQGAQVVEDALASGKLSGTAKANFRGAAIAGNPTYVHGEYVDVPGNGIWNGKLADWHHSVDFLKGKNNKGKKVQLVRSYCYSNDLFCQSFGVSSTVHNSYYKEPTPSRMEKFLRQFA